MWCAQITWIDFSREQSKQIEPVRCETIQMMNASAVRASVKKKLIDSSIKFIRISQNFHITIIVRTTKTVLSWNTCFVTKNTLKLSTLLCAIDFKNSINSQVVEEKMFLLKKAHQMFYKCACKSQVLTKNRMFAQLKLLTMSSVVTIEAYLDFINIWWNQWAQTIRTKNKIHIDESAFVACERTSNTKKNHRFAIHTVGYWTVCCWKFFNLKHSRINKLSKYSLYFVCLWVFPFRM